MSSSCTPSLSLIGRIFIAALFGVTVFGEIMNFKSVVGFMTSVGIPLASLALIIAIAIKLGGAIGLLLGYKTQWAAWALIFFTVLSTAFFHLDLGDQTQLIAFLKNLAIVGGLLYILAYGPGSMSLDERGGPKIISSM